ncbi:MMPL family transporter [Streptomyces sp. TLI_171]|uniref:MMPL family transporter n=1 Tax=Streptomyces sp. TLI_171 TaxID=1938859 RepID=UPI000C45387B|nr:MMPL family transporter [Streptomyces sp. TLI_171]RKE23690.1 RND superfamily putative drug exporter [Streptomyces sp. TLI_171]
MSPHMTGRTSRPVPHAARTTGPRRPRTVAWLVLLLTVVGLGAVFALGPSDATTTEATGASLPASSQSAEVAEIVKSFPAGAVAPAIVVFSNTDGSPLTAAQQELVSQRSASLGAFGLAPEAARPQVVEDKVATVAVLLPTAAGDDENTAAVDRIRQAASADLAAPLQAQVTGGPAFRADVTKVFAGADSTLLIATASVVAVLLLITYRSPVLWLVPLIVVGAGDRTAGILVGALAPHVGVEVDASAAGILSVLVFGAGTDYALLLVSRYRDELHLTDDRFTAMARAWRGTAPAVLASGTTVVLSLLTLLAAELTGNRGLGFAGAVGILTAMLFGLVVLPAALVLPGRWLFWPLVPKVGDPVVADRRGLWSRIGQGVAKRPAQVAVAGTAVLLVLASGALGLRTGLAQEDSFRRTPEAVLGQRTLAAVQPAGAVDPLTLLSSTATGDQVADAARQVPGVSSVTPGGHTDRWARADVVLDSAPGTAASDRTIDQLRRRVAQVPDSGALVGGATAEAYDTSRANAHDTRLVVPLVLAIVLVVLIALLRALVAPLLLVATVILSYFAALGASWTVFRTFYDFPATDTNVPLLSFLFLVALGVDYNIFLIARTREDTVAGHDTRRAVLRALASTGGVITSAGILLAAVFAVLGVLPLITLTQIGIIVGIGVLLDTLLVRTVLVPALVLLTGRRFWWPGRPETAGGSKRAGVAE